VHLGLGSSAFSGQLLSVLTELAAVLTEEIVVAVQTERIVELERGWLSTRRIVTNPHDF
jgi:hypothetical protein